MPFSKLVAAITLGILSASFIGYGIFWFALDVIIDDPKNAGGVVLGAFMVGAIIFATCLVQWIAEERGAKGKPIRTEEDQAQLPPQLPSLKKLQHLHSQGAMNQDQLDDFEMLFQSSSEERAKGIISRIEALHDQLSSGEISEGRYQGAIQDLLDQLDRNPV